MKKKLAATLSVVLILGLAVLGILAYLTSEDSDVNVMTLGNVKIDQIEKQRIEQSDDNTASTNLEDFEQAKPLYPAVGEYAWADNFQVWPTGGTNKLFSDSLKNVQDKIVFVENTGVSDAYVRTWIAFEQGALTPEEFYSLVSQNINTTFWTGFASQNWIYNVEIDGNTYAICCGVYQRDAGKGDGVLPAGETTRPSLMQVYLESSATNEDCEKMDGNKNGTYDILVFSQAVQAEGFADAETALNTAFGEVNAANNPWNGETITFPAVFSSYDAYAEYANDGGIFVVADDFNAENYLRFRPGTSVEFDLNGKTITAENTEKSLFWAESGGTTHLTGEGTVNAGKAFFTTSGPAEIIIDGGTYNLSECNDKGHLFSQNSGKIIINEGTFISNDPDTAIAYCINGFIEINGGFFQNTANPNQALLNMGNNKKYMNNQKITLSGGTFVNWNPMDSAFARPWTNPDVPALIVLADGYTVVSETQSNGDIWYSVVPK